ncbi:hypothetical protein HID58_036089 [Brassica napus]|uniref:HD domain-containing protein n=1 Tax=Brassica napus TaxID=3708 RepID=A0ABQ8C703_BRANA|nr:hypothetical protein HID58_036089 [Brassica napus]
MRNVMNRIYFSKSLSLTPPHLPFFHLSAAASSPNRAVHCMADDSPLSQPPNRSGDGSVSVPPPSPASSAIDFLSLCSRLKGILHLLAGSLKKRKTEERAKHLNTCANSWVEEKEVAEEIAELWREYEANASPEAKLVKDFDKLEMILQALEYEQEQGKDLEEFFQSTAGKFQTDIGKAWALEIASRRRKRQ